MEIVYKPIGDLSNWAKNAQIRKISQDNLQKLLLSLRREGVKEPFKIDGNGIVYDGNNRLKGLTTLIAEGIITSENGVDLQMVPCVVSDPQTEAQKIDLALTGNEQFASWDQQGLMEYLPEFENDLDMSLFNVNFFDEKSINDQIIEKPIIQNSSTEQKDQMITCPNCQHVFSIDK